MRPLFAALTLEARTIEQLELVEEMLRRADLFTDEEVSRQVAMRNHLSETANNARLLVNSLITKADGTQVFDLIDRPARQAAVVGGSDRG
jgi:hypothetical protein